MPQRHILHGMFVRINWSGGRRYLQIVESYRNEAGKPRHRVIANLGRIDGMEDGHLDTLIRGLSRAAGRDEPAKAAITHEPAVSFGDVFALHELWKDLGFDRALGRLAARREHAAPIIAALKPWLEAQLSRIPQKSQLAEDIRYTLGHWPGLIRFLDNGILELDTNPVENQIRPIALTRMMSDNQLGRHRQASWPVVPAGGRA